MKQETINQLLALPAFQEFQAHLRDVIRSVNTISDIDVIVLTSENIAIETRARQLAYHKLMSIFGTLIQYDTQPTSTLDDYTVDVVDR